MTMAPRPFSKVEKPIGPSWSLSRDSSQDSEFSRSAMKPSSEVAV